MELTQGKALLELDKLRQGLFVNQVHRFRPASLPQHHDPSIFRELTTPRLLGMRLADQKLPAFQIELPHESGNHRQ